MDCLRDFYKITRELAKRERKLKPEEIGCYNCVRLREVNDCRNSCIAFSKFKNIEMLNKELMEKGLDYLCTTSIEEFRRKSRLDDDILNLISKLTKQII